MTRILDRFALVVFMLALLAAACGGPSDNTEAISSEPEVGPSATEPEVATESSGGAAALQAVYDELEGLQGQERSDRLVELAQSEEAELSYYTSLNADDVGPLIDEFEEQYGLAMTYYRAGGGTVVQRILQEVDAGFPGADVVQIDGSEVGALDNEGLLLPLETPYREDIVEVGQYENWLATHLVTMLLGWSNAQVTAEEVPRAWEELFDYEGEMAFQVEDYDWFMALTTEYFGDQLGWTEEQTVEAFKEMMRTKNVQVYSGHSLASQLMGAGEFDLQASMFLHHMDRHDDFEWQPAVEPVVVRPNGMGILVTTQAPAQALLWTEFMLTRGQEQMFEVGRTPASKSVEGGLPEDVEAIALDLDELLENREHWQGLWLEIIDASGVEVQEG